jgi:hypothetical protein
MVGWPGSWSGHDNREYPAAGLLQREGKQELGWELRHPSWCVIQVATPEHSRCGACVVLKRLPACLSAEAARLK